MAKLLLVIITIEGGLFKQNFKSFLPNNNCIIFSTEHREQKSILIKILLENASLGGCEESPPGYFSIYTCRKQWFYFKFILMTQKYPFLQTVKFSNQRLKFPRTTRVGTTQHDCVRRNKT